MCQSMFLWVLFLLLNIVQGLNSTYYNSSAITFNGSLIQPDTTLRNFEYQGVCIGGWLVLEPYITPSLFLTFNATNGTEKDIPWDEYRYTKKLGKKEAKKRLEKHWSSFYTEDDFKKIKKLGLNMVRIPIGYWAFEQLDGDPYVYGAQEYLDKAIGWAYNNDLKVWVDLHGVPGSQNGFDNSGYRDIGYPGWFNKTENVEVSHKVLNKIYSKYGGYNMTLQYPDTIIGIEVVNEPMGSELSMKKIKSFYKTAYEDAREIQKVNNTVVLHDAFQPTGYWDHFLTYQNASNSTTANYNILIDHHHYEAFSANVLNSTIAEHIDNIKSLASGIKKELKYHPAVVGEWLAALTDCTPWLNGVGLGARYDGTKPYDNKAIGKCDEINNFDAWTDKMKKDYRKFIEIQLDQYESKANGWIFWCFKTETSIEWDLSRLVDLDLFPQPLDDRKYIINGTDTDPDSDDDNDDGSSKENSATSISLTSSSFLFLAFFWLFHYIV